MPLRPARASAPMLVALFWVATYGVLMLRAEIVSLESVYFVNERRFVATSVGAILYWGILRLIDSSPAQVRQRPLATLALVLPASAIVLAARLMFDQLVPESASSLLWHLHWVLFWAGYFGTWVAISIAYRVSFCENTQPGTFHRSAPVATSASSSVSLDPPAPANTHCPASIEWLASVIAREPGSTRWLADVIVEAVAARPVAERDALLARLQSASGHQHAECAFDPAGAAANARAALIDGIVTRTARDRP